MVAQSNDCCERWYITNLRSGNIETSVNIERQRKKSFEKVEIESGGELEEKEKILNHIKKVRKRTIWAKSKLLV